jgi:hypothetical protein
MDPKAVLAAPDWVGGAMPTMVAFFGRGARRAEPGAPPPVVAG